MISPLPVPPDPSAAETPIVTIVGSTSPSTARSTIAQAGKRADLRAWLPFDDVMTRLPLSACGYGRVGCEGLARQLVLPCETSPAGYSQPAAGRVKLSPLTRLDRGGRGAVR